MRSRAPSSILLLAAFVLAGCGLSAPRIGGEMRPKFYRSAVSLAPGATEVVSMKAPHVRLMGTTTSCNYPPGLKGHKIAMKGMKPDYERIAEIKPELVVYDADLTSEADVAKFKELGIETFGFRGKTVKEYIESLYRFGALVGSETGISEYCDQILSAINQADAVGFDPKPKVAMLLPGSGSEHMIAGTRSFYADLLRSAGGHPVGPEADVFVALSAESLVSKDPDFVFVAGSRDPVLKDPRLASLQALKNARVVQLNPDVALRRGMRVNSLINEVRRFMEESLAARPVATARP